MHYRIEKGRVIHWGDCDNTIGFDCHAIQDLRTIFLPKTDTDELPVELRYVYRIVEGESDILRFSYVFETRMYLTIAYDELFSTVSFLEIVHNFYQQADAHYRERARADNFIMSRMPALDPEYAKSCETALLTAIEEGILKG